MDLPIMNQSGTKAGNSEVRLTELAAEKVKELLAERQMQSHGLRLGVRGGGCSGNSYFMEFAEKGEEGDHAFESFGVKLFVDERSLMLLGGTEVDFVTGLMGSGFKFNNPNVRHSCACGESFNA
jgi:iron-sulfur cluster assembly accessory protein